MSKRIKSHSSWDSRSRSWQFTCGGCQYSEWGFENEIHARDALFEHLGNCKYAQAAS